MMPEKVMFSAQKSLVSEKILGVVLAGGQSSRMGTDKASLEIRGQNFLEKTKALLRDTGVDEVVVSANHIEGAMRDIQRHCGPMSAFHALANWAKVTEFDLAIVMPIDMPLVDADCLKLLIEKTTKTDTTCCFESYPLPLCLRLNRHFIEKTNELMIKKEFAIKNILTEMSATFRSLPEKYKYQFKNVNTPEQFSQVTAIYNQRH